MFNSSVEPSLLWSQDTCLPMYQNLKLEIEKAVVKVKAESANVVSLFAQFEIQTKKVIFCGVCEKALKVASKR
jgi:hypothetical protein